VTSGFAATSTNRAGPSGPRARRFCILGKIR
jgi:hypothetical protein